MEIEQLKKIIESLLFVSETPLSAKKVASFLKGTHEEELNRLSSPWRLKSRD